LGGRRVDRFGEFGVPMQPIAVAPDVDDVATVPDMVQQRRCHHLVPQDLAPFLETLFEVDTIGALLCHRNGIRNNCAPFRSMQD